jgi:hypothetical protein
MRKRNLTLAISPEAHLKARLWAARYDVSLSAIVSTLLEGLPDNPKAVRAAERSRRGLQRPVSAATVDSTHAQPAHPTLPPCEPVKLVNLSS